MNSDAKFLTFIFGGLAAVVAWDVMPYRSDVTITNLSGGFYIGDKKANTIVYTNKGHFRMPPDDVSKDYKTGEVYNCKISGRGIFFNRNTIINDTKLSECRPISKPPEGPQVP